MNMKQKKLSEIAETIGELSKSNLKHVYVEGVDDVKIYAAIARKKDLSTKLSFQQQGGRTRLLALYKAINATPKLSEKAIFLADKDTFVFNSIPSEYENIEFTEGYSIENDLFVDGYDFLMNELSQAEKMRFDHLINSISEWYAFEIEKVLADNSAESKIAINGLDPNIIAPQSDELESAFLLKRNYVKASEELHQNIRNNYGLLLRGKILFEVLLRISFDRGSDAIRHKEITPIWNIAITHGLQVTGSNCNKIVRIFENRMSQV